MKFRIKGKAASLIIILAMIISSCSSAVKFSSGGRDGSATGSRGAGGELAGKVYRGLASYYADKFNGRKTANGDIFDNAKLTAAHKTLPFGTKVQVTNLSNGKSVVVVINDRGPFVEGRIIDLSKAAAMQLDMIRPGVVEVEIRVLE